MHHRLLFLSGLALALAIQAGTAQAQDGERDPNKVAAERAIAPGTQAIISDFGNQAMLNGGDCRAEFERNQHGDIDFYSVLETVNTHKNPLISSSCYQAAFAGHIAKMGEGKVREHLEGEARKAADHGLTYSAYLQHLLECKLCGPLVGDLTECHIESVARSRRELILFDIDKSELRSTERSKLTSLARDLRNDANLIAVVIGRASRTSGKAHCRQALYNKRLSRQRAESVVDELVAASVPRGRICQLGIGWESPHLNDWTADRYGYRSDYLSEGELRMNQSAIAVLQPRDGERIDHPCLEAR